MKRDPDQETGLAAENARLFDAFVAGFLTSGEGWNGEWPYGMYGPINHPQRAEVEDALRSYFEEWVRQSDGLDRAGEVGPDMTPTAGSGAAPPGPTPALTDGTRRANEEGGSVEA